MMDYSAITIVLVHYIDHSPGESHWPSVITLHLPRANTLNWPIVHTLQCWFITLVHC